jgi:hypothetical protein
MSDARTGETAIAGLIVGRQSVAPNGTVAVLARCVDGFFGTFECELVDCYRFRTTTEAEKAMFRLATASTIRTVGIPRSASAHP